MDYTWQYYDVVLFGVALAMGLGAVVGVATEFPLAGSVTAFALVAVAIIGHGLFVNGPVDDPEDLAEEVETLN